MSASGAWSHGRADAHRCFSPAFPSETGREISIKRGHAPKVWATSTAHIQTFWIMADTKAEETTIVQETNGNGKLVPDYNLAENDDAGESFLTMDRKLVRKIDFHLLPWICILYTLGLLDRYDLFSMTVYLIVVSISALQTLSVWVKSWF